jgi:hypothetical protein
MRIDGSEQRAVDALAIGPRDEFKHRGPLIIHAQCESFTHSVSFVRPRLPDQRRSDGVLAPQLGPDPNAIKLS